MPTFFRNQPVTIFRSYDCEEGGVIGYGGYVQGGADLPDQIRVLLAGLHRVVVVPAALVVPRREGCQIRSISCDEPSNDSLERISGSLTDDLGRTYKLEFERHGEPNFSIQLVIGLSGDERRIVAQIPESLVLSDSWIRETLSYFLTGERRIAYC